MQLSRLVLILSALLFAAPAYAQKTGSALNTEVITNFPDNTTGAITPAILRQTITDIINSILTSAGCPTQVLGFGADGVTPQCYSAFSGALGSISVKVRSSSAASVTISATTDYFLCLDPTSNTINAHLPSSPSTGLTFLIKDCTGQASTHNVTVTPAAGNIDGAGTFVMSVNYQSIAVTYTGAQWSIN